MADQTQAEAIAAAVAAALAATQTQQGTQEAPEVTATSAETLESSSKSGC